MFSDRVSAAVVKELTQFHTLKCFQPRDQSTLTRDDCRNALTSLMFLTKKRSGKIKARACANGSTQQSHIAKEEVTAPTVTSEAIFIQGTIFTHEGRDVATCDIPGAFLQADNPDYVLMQLDGILAELMVQVAPICDHQCKRQGSPICPAGESCIWNDEECSSFLPKAGCIPYFSWLCNQSI